MSKLQFNQQLLTSCMERDGAEQEEKYEKLNRDTKIKFKCNCGNITDKTFRSLYKFRAFCKDCTQKNTQDKMKATNLEKRGVEHPSQSQEVKDKMKATNLEKRGVENPFQSEEVKDKMKATNLERYGFEHPFQSEEIKEKSKATCMVKYGKEYSLQSQEVKDKSKATNLEKRGVEHPLQSQKVKDKIKATCMGNYGVEHPLQNPEIAEKSSKNAYKKKEVITPSGNVITLQGYEPQAYKILLETYTEEEILNSEIDVPEIWWVDNEGKRRRYFVDFYIPKDNLMIEIKSKRTLNLDDKKEKIEKTLQASSEAGYNIELWVMDKKGNILEKIVKN